jgi:molybdopterin-guanine dinucleotide biosynthesis protein A
MLEPTPAYILSGGKSSRFGSDKARALLEGQPLIARQAAILRNLGCPVTAVAEVADKYADISITTIADSEPGLGPLGGLLAALSHAAPGWILVTSCDLLELRAAWTAQLLSAISPAARAIAYRDDRWQPFPALYHTTLRDEVRSRIARRELSLWKLLDAVETVAPPLPKDWAAMRQANTPEDLPPSVP